MTFGPFSSAQSLSGLIVTDTLATAGNLLFYGTLTTARTVAIGDSSRRRRGCAYHHPVLRASCSTVIDNVPGSSWCVGL